MCRRLGEGSRGRAGGPLIAGGLIPGSCVSLGKTLGRSFGFHLARRFAAVGGCERVCEWVKRQIALDKGAI